MSSDKIQFKLNDYHRNVSDEELVADLKRTSLELNKTAITQDDYRKKGKFNPITYSRRFGSWPNALEKAGLDKTRSPMNIPEEELFQNLEEVWMSLGRQPTHSEMRRPLSRFSGRPYLSRFGGWRNALEAFIKSVEQDSDSLGETSSAPNKQTPKRTSRNINWRLRYKILIRDKATCQLCGRSPLKDPRVELHVDHIKAWSKGGETVLENLRLLCSKCNIGKSDLAEDAFE